MNLPDGKAFVETVTERCRTCFTCVRECPAKAIRINDGQAQVLPERCIACGNCVRVCSQDAKQVVSTLDQVEQLLDSSDPVAACLAPSFPAEFPEADVAELVGGLRSLGFDKVIEVAFGADLVAQRYRELLAENSRDGERYIATSCPAITRFVEKHHPELTERLAPIVSPMIATARALHEEHGDDMRVVFIGPCVAKKLEASTPGIEGEVDVAITFAELRRLLFKRRVHQESVKPSEFDPPHPNLGALFPISRGMLQAADIQEDLTNGDVVAADGRQEFVEAINEFEEGALDARLLEVLCCSGCIMGPGMTCQTPRFRRRAHVSQYVNSRVAGYDKQEWHKDMRRFGHLDLTRNYSADDQRLPEISDEDLRPVLARMGKQRPQDELDCGACGYPTCREHAAAIVLGLAENEMCLPYAIETLHKTVSELADSHRELASTQEALMQSEKLASMGQLAAGIAHEVNNPLGVVLMYAHLLRDEAPADSDISKDLGLIAEQADRCKKIVAGLLDFARQTKVCFQEVDAAEIMQRALRAVPAPENVQLRSECTLRDGACEMDADQILQVFTNIISNAYAAMPEGGKLFVRTSGDQDDIRYEICDTGNGIAEENLKKIFEPFFTTKKMGKGTGLGLSVAYGIVKMHRGQIDVHSNANPSAGPTGTTFIVRLPRQGRME